MQQLFKATEYMHRTNICHRDLKPDNIMVASNSSTSSQLNRENSYIKGADEEQHPVAETIKVKVIDLNVAFEVTPQNPRIRFGTGLKEWSAPETRNAQY